MQAHVTKVADRVDAEYFLKCIVKGAAANPQFIADFQGARRLALPGQDVLARLLHVVAVNKLTWAVCQAIEEQLLVSIDITNLRYT